MGLFSKKECVRCGNKAGLLTRKKLADDEYLCGDCVDECSPELTSDDFRTMTADDVEEHIKSVQEDAERYRNEFVKTKIFRTQMVLKNKDILYADDSHGWWVNATRENPDVFTYDQVASFRLDLDTSTKDDEDDKDKDLSLLNTLYESAALMSMRQQYPDMPIASPREQIERMEFVVYLKNRPYISEVRIPVMDALVPSEGDIEGGYETAYQLMNFFKSLSSWSGSQQAAVPSQAAPAAAVSPAPDMADQLLKLKQLLDAGILTQDEFDAKKKQILGL